MNCKLKLSPCPNDTFAFYALIHNEIDTEGLTFDVEFYDIEVLNEMILSGDGDIIKGSVAVAHKAQQQGYTLLDAGAALGRGNGPIVVRKAGDNRVVALPGELTTATLLFNRYFEGFTPLYTRFNRVVEKLSSGEAELGVLIHEGRFTYAEHGCEKVADLGEMWEAELALPLPLGAIYGNSLLDTQKMERVIRRSIEWAFDHREDTLEFVRSHASELSEEVLQNHIDYFVNDYSLSLGSIGRAAISLLGDF